MKMVGFNTRLREVEKVGMNAVLWIMGLMMKTAKEKAEWWCNRSTQNSQIENKNEYIEGPTSEDSKLIIIGWKKKLL